MIMANEYKTAITRKSPSLPMKRLAADGLIKGKALDYGSGRGFDAMEYGMACYDPYFQPDLPDGLFNTITCNYVLNVIERDKDRIGVLLRIQNRLARGGIAYITVRNDRRALKGTTEKGTWQGLIVLRLPVRYKCAGYVTYELSGEETVDLSLQASYVER